MRANRAAGVAGTYTGGDIVGSGAPTIPAMPAPACISTNANAGNNCTAAQLAAYDTWYWLAQDVTQLPSGAGSITTTPQGSNWLITVTVQWDDSLAATQLNLGAAASSPSAGLATIVVSTLL
jgi:type IV pilus assembly protein PilV